MAAKFLRFLHEHTILALTILFTVGMFLIFGNVLFLAQRTNEDLAVQYAALYVRSLEKFRTEYGSEVVGRLENQGVQVTHDYNDHEGAIPIPATFAIGLSDSITEPESGIKARLYSDYPFPWREDGGPHDDFEMEAMIGLRTTHDVNEPYVTFEDFDGRYSLRYAKAVTMQESCVECHNTHELSPKTNWQVGDVRGVQEVIIPLDSSIATIRGGLLSTLGIMLMITIAGLAILFLVLRALRSSIKMLSLTNTAYARFVPHEFLSLLGKNSIVEVDLADNVQREMTILFTDIRSFTTISEGMLPEENFRFINEFLSRLGPIIRENNGFIDKYIGDAIMALFDNPDDAVNAAIGLILELWEFNQFRIARHLEPVKIGIGLNTGKLMLGTIGENDRMDGTVISDAVNVASRIEGMTKMYGVPLVIAESTYLGLTDRAKYAVRLMDKVQVKGKKDPITVYEVFNADSEKVRAQKLAKIKDFELAIGLYQNQHFQEAKRLFEKCLKVYPDDQPVTMYIERCDHYLRVGWDDDWDGVLHMVSK